MAQVEQYQHSSLVAPACHRSSTIRAGIQYRTTSAIGKELRFLHSDLRSTNDDADSVIDIAIKPVIDIDFPAACLIGPDQLSMAIDYWHLAKSEDGSAVGRQEPTQHKTLDNASSGSITHESWFCQEVIQECFVRAQALERLEELEDNDGAIEAVAALEIYRQSGWAEEMIRMFPGECWLFWCEAGLSLSLRKTKAL